MRSPLRYVQLVSVVNTLGRLLAGALLDAGERRGLPRRAGFLVRAQLAAHL